MGSVSVTLRRADDATLSYVETLLAENDLPSGDVPSSPGTFYVAYDGGDPVGVGGVEVYGADGLLRSVVVERPARGEGYGTALCEALEAEARTEGVGTLYLLTTTASDFFADRGYVETDRSYVPGSIRGTVEFEDLCPSTATCMRKRL